MRFISVTDNRTGHADIVCMSSAAKIVGVNIVTLYRWEQKTKQETFRHWTVNFDVTIYRFKKTIRKAKK